MQQSASKVVFLIRHAESMKNLSDRFGDPRQHFMLTDAGINETDELGKQLFSEFLPGVKDRVLIVCNREARAHHTAEILSKQLNLPLIAVNGLDPIDSGLLSGVTESDARDLYPEIMKKKESYRTGELDGYELEYPGGDRVADFQGRVMKSFFSVVSQEAFEIFWIVGHQSTITAILSFFANQNEQKKFYHYFKLDFCGISKLSLDGSGLGRIDFINRIL